MGAGKCQVTRTDVRVSAPLVGAFIFTRTDSAVEGPGANGSLVFRSPELQVTVQPFTPSDAEDLLRRQGWLEADAP
jgi:hypothetical protein